MKIAPLLITLYIVMAAIMLFDGTYSLNSITLDPYNSSVVNGTGNSTSQGSMWAIFWNPTQLGNQGFVDLLVQALFLGVGLVIVTSLFVKSDITLLTPGCIALASAGVIPIIALWNVLHRELWQLSVRIGDCCSAAQIETGAIVNGVTCAVNTPCVPSILLTGLVVGPIAVMWILSCVEWLVARPMS